MNKKLVAASTINEWRVDGVKFVRDNFKVEPDIWQKEALIAFCDPKESRLRLALQACAGPGKSTVLAWCAWLWISCYFGKGEHPKGIATSVTAANLKDNLWAELAKWRARSPFLMGAFEWTHERIFHKSHPEDWFIAARPWPKKANPEEQGRTLSGLHSEYPIVIFDECGEIPLSLLRTAEQALSNCKMGRLGGAGNPTSLDGILYHVVTKLSHQWKSIRITGDPDDPKRSPRVDIHWAREQIKTFGRDNPWVMSYILGLFPPASINTLLGPDEVHEAMKRQLPLDAFEWSDKRLGVDVARFGDDRTVIFPRQGLHAEYPITLRNQRTTDIADTVYKKRLDYEADEIFVDDSGHWGHGVIDNLIRHGANPQAVFFEGKALDPRYKNKRAEMWIEMAEWVKRGGALPDMPELARELTAPTYTFENGRFVLEPKDLIKKRIGFSPDCFVAGTMVATPKGPTPIENIQVGECVATPMGPRKVTHVWKSNTARITTAKFSNGAVLSGKPTHKIFTWDKGWVALDALSMVNDIESYTYVRRLRWWILRKLFTEVSPSTFRQAVDTISLGGKMSPRDFFTEGFGGIKWARYLRGFASTTRMEIGAIIDLVTLKLFPRALTCASTCRKTWPTPSLEPWHYAPLKALKGLQLSGTQVKRVESGTPSTGFAPGSGVKPNPLPVLFVEKEGSLSSRAEHGFVQSRVRKKCRISLIRLPRRAVNFARKAFTLISTAPKSVAPVSVQTAIEKSCVNVYNLTLESDNIYYANGILVANCGDALALTFAIPDAPRGMMAKLEGLGKHHSDYNPYEEKHLGKEYDPYKDSDS